MVIAVGLACLLMAVAVLEGVTGTPFPQNGQWPQGALLGASGVILPDGSFIYLQKTPSDIGSSIINLKSGRPRPAPVPTFPTFGEQGCELSGVVYESGDITEDTCLIMRCNNGAWNYLGRRTDCGECDVDGDPHFFMFDRTDFLDQNPRGNKYRFTETGNYVITQQGKQRESLFGVTSTFETCNTHHASNLSCITSITYYEPGVTVDVELPPQETQTTFPNCTEGNHDPTIDPNCQFKVKVNFMEENIMGKAARNFQGSNGNVLVFIENHIGGADDLFCMNVVGSQGLSVSLCQHRENFAFLYVFPMANLRSDASQLFGLCNSYTGTTQSGFRTGPYFFDPQILIPALTQDKELFGESWSV